MSDQEQTDVQVATPEGNVTTTVKETPAGKTKTTKTTKVTPKAVEETTKTEPVKEPAPPLKAELQGILNELTKVSRELRETTQRLKDDRKRLIKEAVAAGGKIGAISDAAELSTIRVRDLAKS
jgi:molecular chaperone GrpE (heat shock protein)